MLRFPNTCGAGGPGTLLLTAVVDGGTSDAAREPAQGQCWWQGQHSEPSPNNFATAPLSDLFPGHGYFLHAVFRVLLACPTHPSASLASLCSGLAGGKQPEAPMSIAAAGPLWGTMDSQFSCKPSI